MHTNFYICRVQINSTDDKFVWGSKRTSRWDQWWLKGARKIGLTVMDSRQQNHEDEGDDWRETICNHDHDHRTMCFSQSRCSQSLRTCSLHPRCMESSHTAGPITVAVNFCINLFFTNCKSTSRTEGVKKTERMKRIYTVAVFDRQVLPKLVSLSSFSRPKWLNERVRTFWFLVWCTVRDRGRVASDEGQTSFRRLCGRSAPSGFSMRFTSTHRSPPYPISTGANFSST